MQPDHREVTDKDRTGTKMRAQPYIDRLAKEIDVHDVDGYSERQVLILIAKLLLRILAEIMETNNK